MSRKTFKLVAVLLLAVFLYPVVESVDVWDAAGPSNDTELTLVGIAIGIGLLFALSRLLNVVPDWRDFAAHPPANLILVAPAKRP